MTEAIEIIKVITMLCNIQSSSPSTIETVQLKCQQYYIKCIKDAINDEFTLVYPLNECVLKREL